MIGLHLAGIGHSYKKLNITPGHCLSCGEYSECQILKYEKYAEIFFIKTKVLNEEFWFDWKDCNHRVVLFDPESISRYQLEQVETGIFSVPYYQNMLLYTMPIPKKVPTYQIVLVVALSLAFGFLLEFLSGKLHLPFIP